jgi:hypothetical protein
MSDWLPIETAPKGPMIILYGAGEVTVGGWISAADQGVEPGMEHTVGAGWWSMDTVGDPTHWMPLPDPPEGDA